MDLVSKTVVLTGATGGIGQALVKKLLEEKVQLICIGRSDEKLQKLHQSFSQIAKCIACDFIKQSDITKAIELIRSTVTNINIFINATGVGIYKSLEEVNNEEWNESLAVNASAPFFFLKGLLSIFTQKDSLVLTIGSGAGVISMKNRSVYCASKFALRGLILSLAEEYVDKSPSFCLITLGSTLTKFGTGNALTLEEKIKQHQQGSAYFTPEWVANKLIDILKDEKRQSEITLYPGDFGFGSWKKP